MANINMNQELILKAKEASSAEELMALAKENGMEMTEEQAQAYFDVTHKTGELADDELDNVAGGGCGGGGGGSSGSDWRDSFYDGMYVQTPDGEGCTTLTDSPGCQGLPDYMKGYFYYTNREEQTWKVVCEKCGRAYRGMYNPLKTCQGRTVTFRKV